MWGAEGDDLLKRGPFLEFRNHSRYESITLYMGKVLIDEGRCTFLMNPIEFLLVDVFR